MSTRKVSYSQLNTFRDCPQKWHYSYVQGLTKETGSRVPADAGSWWHAVRAADNIAKGRTLGTLKHAPKELRVDTIVIPVTSTLAVQTVLDAADQWWSSVPEEMREEWTAYLGEELPQRLRTMESNYQERWGDTREHEHPIAVEVGWGRPLSDDVRLGGYVDLVYRDTKRNLVVVRDYKTSKALGTTHTHDDLLDSQLPFYAWGVAERVAEWGVGPIKATSYDRIRIVAPKKPVLTAAGGLSKSITDYDLHTYLSWAAGPDGDGVPYGTEGEYYASGKRKGEPKWGRYTADPAVVARLSSKAEQEKWEQRTLTPLNLNLIRSHLRAAADTSEALGQVADRLPERGEAPRNFTWTCKWCDFSDLCLAQLIGGPDGEYDPEDYGLVQRDRR